jgi:hypothetical protein
VRSDEGVSSINIDSYVTLIGLTLTGGYYQLSPFPGLQGGAIFVDGGVLTLRQCALTGNSADYGGAIHNKDGVLFAVNSTFYGNSATVDGGAIRNEGLGAFSWLVSSTLSGNSAGGSGGGVFNPAGGLRIQNSIVAGNTAAVGGADIAGAVMGTSSLIGDPAGATGLGTSLTSYWTGDPRLAPFADWSGPSASMPPLPGSPVIDVADSSVVNPIDQRGAPRPSVLADLGSVELFGFP